MARILAWLCLHTRACINSNETDKRSAIEAIGKTVADLRIMIRPRALRGVLAGRWLSGSAALLRSPGVLMRAVTRRDLSDFAIFLGLFSGGVG